MFALFAHAKNMKNIPSMTEFQINHYRRHKPLNVNSNAHVTVVNESSTAQYHRIADDG